MTVGRHCGIVSRIVALLLALVWRYGDAGPLRASEFEHDLPAVRVDISIKARQFHPSPVSVPVGRPVMLVFHNQDVELHAFVPTRFLEGVPVHVDGNGAPQFGEKGLERVLIPSGGTEHIRFMPTTVGEFEYRCDLPGHQMVGKIVVVDQQTDQHTTLDRRTGVQGTP
jgi:plastocyanin